MEFAALLSSLGVEVSVIEMMPEILGNMDRETSALLRAEYAKKGVTFYMQARVTAIDNQTVHFTHEEQEKQITADKILVSVGRKARTNNLEALPLEMAKRGVAVNEHMQTNLANVYAAGDITGYSMLAHTAVCEAEVAVNNILGKQDMMRYHANPSVIYTQPELASVGKTEEECKQKGIAYEVQKLSMRYAGRFVAENEGADGLCKILIDKQKRNIIGVHMIGAYTGEMIWGAAEMLEMQLRVTDARQIIFPHPTVSEIIREVLWEFPD